MFNAFVIVILLATLATSLLTLFFILKTNKFMAALDDAIAKLTADVTAEKAVVDSAIVFINGVPGLISAAVATAQAAGATADQLQALTDLSTKLEAETPALSAALTANTPAAPAV